MNYIADSEQVNARAAGLSIPSLLLCVVGATATFHLAYAKPALSFLIFLYPALVLQVVRARTARQSFYFGLAAGLLTVGPQLNCFWVIFGPGAIALWLILAFWIAAFTGLAHACLRRHGVSWAALLIPFIWTGLEYFRSELYYLRFSWLNVGYALPAPNAPFMFRTFGMYGAGFLTMALAVLFTFILPQFQKLRLKPAMVIATLIPLFCGFGKAMTSGSRAEKTVHVAGIQMEFPSITEIAPALDKALAAHPETELFVLSEYTLDDTVPASLKIWCRQHQRYLIVGGKDPAPNNFYDTAFVIGPTGEILFRQVKSVPIQFFKDGLPAPGQKLWESPWGKIGICICYDLSYTRVTDRLIRMGAQALVVPTMDVMDWGKREHELHARVAPIRAAEYGVPIFRVASSGISQLVLPNGQTAASANFPGQGESLVGTMVLADNGSIPFDRWVAPFASAICASLLVMFVAGRFSRRASTGIEGNRPGWS